MRTEWRPVVTLEQVLQRLEGRSRGTEVGANRRPGVLFENPVIDHAPADGEDGDWLSCRGRSGMRTGLGREKRAGEATGGHRGRDSCTRPGASSVTASGSSPEGVEGCGSGG